MSRSFRKHPMWIDSTMKKHGKRYANRKVRHSKGLPNGSYYKRLYDSWEICDYKWLADSKSSIKSKWKKGDREIHDTYDNLQEAIRFGRRGFGK